MTFNVWASGLNDYDRQIVASCMVLEAGCDGVEGMQAVLNVILNRSDSYLHRMVPNVSKRGAFSSMSDVWHDPSPNYSGIIRRAQAQPKEYVLALRIIQVMEAGRLWDNTYGSTHFHAHYIRPYWVSDMRYVTSIGGHTFYVENS